MQQSIDDLLEEWEKVKKFNNFKNETLSEAIDYECEKNLIETWASDIRQSRFENNQTAEKKYIEKFVENYEKFNKKFVYKVLKNG